ncbi:MAG: single-stranded DNA-binding protein, partial [Actinomycetota bacterium]|nr:single-stranded DNA-binding protein [Actinomycetota bacterium]
SGIQANKDMVSQKTKRKKNFVSNILVISDPAAPENEGKVFLFRYGMKIHQKLVDAMKPEFADEEPIIPFDFWQGANFRLRQRKVAGYPNYDKSEFDSVSALYEGDEEKLKEVWATQYPLSEFVDPANYKSYDELKTRLETVLGGSQPTNTAENTSVDDVVTTDTTSEAAPQKSVEPDSEEDALSYFQRLSEED